jgi:hypothetical protein
MATVQRYGPRRVGRATLPGVRKDAAETPLSRGAGLEIERARTADRLAGLVAGVADVGLRGYAAEIDAERRHADQVAILKADNRLAEFEASFLYGDGTPEHPGALRRQGENALGLPEEALDAWTEAAGAIQGEAQTQTQKDAVAEIVARRKAGFNVTVRRHTADQMTQYEADELKHKITNGTNEAIAKGLSPIESEAALQSTLAAVATHGPNLGLGKQAIVARTEAITSDVRVGVIERLLVAGKFSAAKVYFEETRGQIMGDALARVEKAIEEGSLITQAQQQSDSIIAAGGTLTEQLARAGEIDDPKLRDAVEGRIEHHETVRRSQQLEADRDQLRGVWDILDQSKDVAAIPRTTWANLDPNERAAAHQYAEARARGIPIVTNLSRYYALVQHAGTDPIRFAEVNLEKYRAQLDEGDFKQLAGLQLSIRNGQRNQADDVLSPLMSRAQILSDVLDSQKLDPDDPTALALKRELDKRVEQFQADTGRKASNEQIYQMADTLTQAVILKRGSWLAFLPGGAPLFDVTKKASAVTYQDIPANERTEIERKLRAAGLPVTRDSVTQTFIDWRIATGGVRPK